MGNFNDMENQVNKFRGLIDKFSSEQATQSDKYFNLDKVNSDEKTATVNKIEDNEGENINVKLDSNKDSNNDNTEEITPNASVKS